ncbi:hypothetical protein [Aestuariivirga sp.]|uniref:hypothetical protein n=1 Tax=Aestuariivirga sp. TaxID=2650926 RepID=UPI003593B77B
MNLMAPERRDRTAGPFSSPAEPPALQRLVFGKTGWAIDFEDCADIVDGVKAVMRGWNLKSGPPSIHSRHAPRARISHHDQRWHWTELGAPKARDWDRIPPRTPMRVITDVHDAAIHWYLAHHPGLLCLHGAAARIGRTLVCFPARGFTGKSTLMACLAAQGHRIFADDVLGLEGRTGIGLGFLPRLRATLPAHLTARTRSYIASHQGPADEDWIYLDPGPELMAPLGTRARVGSIVLLERRDEGRTQLSLARTVDVLKPLIAENITRKQPMTQIFEQLHALAKPSGNLVLRYSDPDSAARLLGKHFG